MENGYEPQFAAVDTLMRSTPTEIVKKPKSRYIEDDAFVLQIRPYRETSLLAQILTREHGRISVVAKGAKRLGSNLRQMLLLFQPLQCRWVGQGELKTLTQAEWQGGLPYLQGQSLLLGYYVNELLIQLCQHEDEVKAIFTAYQVLLHQLTQPIEDKNVHVAALRQFEWQLLNALGYAPDMSAWCQQFNIQAQHWYMLAPRTDTLIRTTPNGRQNFGFSGEMLLTLRNADIQDAYLPHYKVFFQQLLIHHAGLKPLNTRQVFSELLEF